MADDELILLVRHPPQKNSLQPRQHHLWPSSPSSRHHEVQPFLSRAWVEIPLAPILPYAEDVFDGRHCHSSFRRLDVVIDMTSILDKQPHFRQLVLAGKDSKDGEQVVATLGAQVRKLFGSPEFIKAFDPMMLAYINTFSLDENDQVQMEYLKSDALFGFFLAEVQDFFHMRF
ncbi:ribulokinase [Striga asiatica]|uniref:Ribulokinase n=1 Tax=Striga asiatica TaxID=4170 RepID=A0A5A7RGL6_STRAF|nr:ribulokinase [Striga asiatica]